MRLTCKNCGWNQVSLLSECRNLQLDGKLQCLKCNSSNVKLKAKMESAINESYFSSESEIRDTILCGVFNQGVIVWDCSGKGGSYPDPVQVAGTMLVPKIGDIPIRYNERFYIIEIKFARYVGCSFKHEDGLFRPKRIRPLVTFKQSAQILKGASIMVLVAEPKFIETEIPAVSSENQSICEELLINKYKLRLASGEIPYDIWVLNRESFKKYWEGGFAFPEKEERRAISFGLLNSLVPENRSRATYSEIIDGEIGNLILKKL